MSFPASKSNINKIRKSRVKKVKNFRPQMTSLVDIMTILLVFLVKSFSTDGNTINVPNDVVLPASSARKAPKATVIISVNNKYLVAGGENIASVKNIIKNDKLLIAPLFKWLSDKKEITEKVAKYSTKTTFKGDITIQGDRKIPFKLLQKIMFTCGRVGFNNFSLAVIQEE